MVSPDVNSIDLVVVGPTASGKTVWATEWALKNNAEIISADSRQIYRGLEIGTAKPGRDILNAVPHHLVNILNPNQSYSAGAFCREARTAILDVKSRGKKVVLVGGTGLYIRSLLFGILELPDEDLLLKKSFFDLWGSKTSEELHEELTRRDPERAENLSVSDRYRVMRSLWLSEWMGVPPTKLFASRSVAGVPFNKIVGIDPGRHALYERIDKRVVSMMQRGWGEEVQQLLANGCSPTDPAFRSLGYPEVLDFLKGKRGFDDTIAIVQRKTRQFAKRQMTWFRHMTPVEWIGSSTSV